MKENVRSLLDQLVAVAGLNDLREARNKLIDEAFEAGLKADENIDENTQDLTVYDLAEKIAAGRILTAAANAEIEDKLAEIHTGLRTLIANTAPVDTPKETAVALLHFRDFLRKLITPMSSSSFRAT